MMIVHGQVSSQATVTLSRLVESCAFALIRRDLFSLSLMKSHLIVNLIFLVGCFCLSLSCWFATKLLVLCVSGLLFCHCH